jgi:hypothetical protein
MIWASLCVSRGEAPLLVTSYFGNITQQLTLPMPPELVSQNRTGVTLRS